MIAIVLYVGLFFVAAQSVAFAAILYFYVAEDEKHMEASKDLWLLLFVGMAVSGVLWTLLSSIF